jgi:hypothetical protein
VALERAFIAAHQQFSLINRKDAVLVPHYGALKQLVRIHARFNPTLWRASNE